MKKKLLLGLALAACFFSCVRVESGVGESLIPIDQQFYLYQADIPIDELEVRQLDSLSGYSGKRITIGAYRDEEFGLTTRSSAFTLVPLYDTLDFGKNPRINSFHFSACKDTLSYVSSADRHSLQNIYVYELSRPLDTLRYDMLSSIDYDSTKLISDGVPVYAGGDSLSFNFSKEYGQKVIDRLKNLSPADLQDIKKYLAKVPGIYLKTDEPTGNGGRINMFDLKIDYDFSAGYLAGNFASLRFRSEYDGVEKDTVFYFYYGANDMYDLDSLFLTSSTTANFPEFCQNVVTHESLSGADTKLGQVGETFFIEGGAGAKPVVTGKTLRRLISKEVESQGAKLSDALVTKAQIVFPYVRPADYTDYTFFPEFLNPSWRIRYTTAAKQKYVTYDSATSTSSSVESPGTIDRSNENYRADVTGTIEQMVKSVNDDNVDLFDIWFLIRATETIKENTSSNSSSNSLTDYYNYLAMSSYYNSLYGGYGGYGGYGYGGYGGYGYGGYGDYYGGYGGYGYGGYGDYYSYYLMSSLYSNSGSSTDNTSVELDRDRFYKAEFYGPKAQDEKKRPYLRITYAIPKE